MSGSFRMKTKKKKKKRTLKFFHPHNGWRNSKKQKLMEVLVGFNNTSFVSYDGFEEVEPTVQSSGKALTNKKEGL